MANSYVVNFGGDTCDTSGYLLVQPFRLNAQGELQPVTGKAKLLVQLHWVKPADGQFPSFSGKLAQRFGVTIKDAKPNTILHVNDVAAETIVSTQSVDIGTALWLLNAVPTSTIKFSPQPQYSRPAGGSGYHPWQGTLRGSNSGINVTYVEAIYDAAQNRTLREFAAMGPANADGAGSFFNLVAGATANQTLPAVQFNDARRKANIDLFGPGAGVAQMANAQGAVFAFNGVFKKCRPADLMRLVRDLSMPKAVGDEAVSQAVWTQSEWLENPLFRDIAQTIEATAATANTNQESFETADSDFEGLLLKGLRSRGEPAATLL
ncbi:hypothetical protein M2212_006227 [Bradyrhizobium elkanii]|uniref:hypothetical protein n=1 Tax=Bradyrhizobium elkanii TaxID=29448 RepID=UPI00216A8293|nr:hypothetical protein [Bradyrhizobium elkanii]MCS3479381.1 hypothetical protein [Bradyrhizobium elkanii]